MTTSEPDRVHPERPDLRAPDEPDALRTEALQEEDRGDDETAAPDEAG